MKKQKKQNLLWRVEWNHIAGYRAPYMYVVAETKVQAIGLSKEKSSFARFPESWSCSPISLYEIDHDGRRKQEREEEH